MKRDTSASHPFFIDMLLTEIFFKGITLPNAPVTRSNRIMKPITSVTSKPRVARQKSDSMSEMEVKVLNILNSEFRPSQEIANKCKITLAHFYQIISKLNKRDLVESKRVSGPGNVRYRHYKRIDK